MTSFQLNEPCSVKKCAHKNHHLDQTWRAKTVMEAQFVRRSDVGDGRPNFISASLCLLHGWREKREKERVVSCLQVERSRQSRLPPESFCNPDLLFLFFRPDSSRNILSSYRAKHVLSTYSGICAKYQNQTLMFSLVEYWVCSYSGNGSWSSHRSADWAWAGEGFQANVGTNHKTTHAVLCLMKIGNL